MNINTGFNLESSDSIDKRLASDNLEWINDSNIRMPDIYFTVSHQIDTTSGKWDNEATLYIYDKTGPSDPDIPDTHFTRAVKQEYNVRLFHPDRYNTTRAKLMELFETNDVSNCDAVVTLPEGAAYMATRVLIWDRDKDIPNLVDIFQYTAWALYDEDKDRWSTPISTAYIDPVPDYSKDEINAWMVTDWPIQKPKGCLSATGTKLIPFYNYTADSDGTKCIMINKKGIEYSYGSYEEFCEKNCPDNSYEFESMARGPWKFSFDPGNSV